MPDSVPEPVPDPVNMPLIVDDVAMRAALDEAGRAQESGDVPIGAVVLVALRGAAQAAGEWRLAGCTLVVTLEPCTMCAGAVVLSRLDRLVFGAYDAKAGAVGSLWDVVRDRRLNHRPEVVGGVLAEACSALLDDFFAHQRLG